MNSPSKSWIVGKTRTGLRIRLLHAVTLWQ
jgi:hypothetical protein